LCAFHTGVWTRAQTTVPLDEVHEGATSVVVVKRPDDCDPATLCEGDEARGHPNEVLNVENVRARNRYLVRKKFFCAL
jgi:hypothetical protein